MKANTTRLGHRTGAGVREFVLGKRALAFDQAASDVFRYHIDDIGACGRFRQHLAPEPRILDEAVNALVASHLDMRDGIDPQARSVAARQTAIEQVNTIRNFRKHWIELFIEELKARNLGVPQIDDHAGALRRLDAGVAHGVAQGLCLVRHRPDPIYGSCLVPTWCYSSVNALK